MDLVNCAYCDRIQYGYDIDTGARQIDCICGLSTPYCDSYEEAVVFWNQLNTGYKLTRILKELK